VRAGTSAGVVEDDHELRGVLRGALERDGLTVRATASGGEAVRMFTETPADVLVVDIGLPDADGRDVCQALRARGVMTPVLFLTARDALTDRISGFHAGGDDYLVKPFELAELLVRIQALLRRARDDKEPRDDGGAVLDPSAHAIVFGDRRVTLTPTEFRLLAALASRPGEVVRRRELVAAGWPDGAIVHDNTLDVYIARLRRKLRMLPGSPQIVTLHGVGYRIK
jgi:two-component system, OmpR family, response regulator